jgi:hypothetical protein
MPWKRMRSQIHASAALLPLYMSLGGSQSLPGRCEEVKNLTHAENRIPAVQPVAHRYTDWSIRLISECP